MDVCHILPPKVAGLQSDGAFRPLERQGVKELIKMVTSVVSLYKRLALIISGDYGYEPNRKYK
jgi:hypothetical protein